MSSTQADQATNNNDIENNILNNYINVSNTEVNLEKELDKPATPPATDFNVPDNILTNIKILIDDEKVYTPIQKAFSATAFGDTQVRKEETEKLKVYRHRIANIFYKAINICYDGKTDFSKNILMKTKTAIENIGDNYIDVLKDNNYFNEKVDPTIASITTNLNTIKEKETIEVIYYDYDNYKKIKVNTTSTDDNIKKKATEAELFLKDKSNIVFFTIENNEIPNKCPIDQIKNDKGVCVECNTVCYKKKDNDTCKTNPDCALFCKDNCKPEPPTPINKCGVKKTDKEKTPPIITKEINTPIDENNISSIYNFSYVFKIAIKIFFSAIIIYLCYIFYQLYGETIVTFINFIFYYFTRFYYNIRYGFNKNNVEFQYHMDEYIKQNAIYKYDKLVTTANSIRVPA